MIFVAVAGFAVWSTWFSPNDRAVTFAQCEARRIAIYPHEDGTDFDPVRPGDPLMAACMRAKNYEIEAYPGDCYRGLNYVRQKSCYVPSGAAHRWMFDVQTGNVSRDPGWPLRRADPPPATSINLPSPPAAR